MCSAELQCHLQSQALHKSAATCNLPLVNSGCSVTAFHYQHLGGPPPPPNSLKLQIGFNFTNRALQCAGTWLEPSGWNFRQITVSITFLLLQAWILPGTQIGFIFLPTFQHSFLQQTCRISDKLGLGGGPYFYKIWLQFPQNLKKKHRNECFPKLWPAMFQFQFWHTFNHLLKPSKQKKTYVTSLSWVVPSSVVWVEVELGWDWVKLRLS